jgi:hypothetical protein
MRTFFDNVRSVCRSPATGRLLAAGRACDEGRSDGGAASELVAMNDPRLIVDHWDFENERETTDNTDEVPLDNSE